MVLGYCHNIGTMGIDGIMGVLRFCHQHTGNNAKYVASGTYSQAYADYLLGTPAWSTAVFALAVCSGALGALADDDVLLYGSYSRGFKSGGFNGRPILEDELTSFNPEYVDAFEVGVKSDLFDKRLRANLAGFYYLYKDMQLNAVTAAPNGNLVVSIDNAGKSKIMGIELELQARPAEGLDMFFNVGYTDAEYTDIGTATSISLGNEFIKTPKWNLSGSVQYSIPLDNEASVTVRGDWTYQSKVYNNVQNSEAIAQNAYSLFNARITYMPPDEAWELALFGTNLTNETYLINGGGVPGSLGYFFGMYGQPREWGVSLSYHF